jgi:hypothetical protein
MKVGDLVCLTEDDTDLGIIIKIVSQPQDDLDDLFSYLIHFADGHADFFGGHHLGVISESR